MGFDEKIRPHVNISFACGRYFSIISNYLTNAKINATAIRINAAISSASIPGFSAKKSTLTPSLNPFLCFLLFNQ